MPVVGNILNVCIMIEGIDMKLLAYRAFMQDFNVTQVEWNKRN